MTQEVFSLNPNYSTTRRITREQPRIEKGQDSVIEQTIFLPANPKRKGDGGLRTKNYFKTSTRDRPLVSIITVVFNGEKYIEETLQSVIGQTYDNVEYIIIDGGSTDGTVNIIKKYEDKIDYWISEPDRGISDAFNKGIALSNGDIIGIINSDDWYEPEAVEMIVNHYDQGDIFYGDMQYWKDGSKDYVYLSDHAKLSIEMTVNHPTVFIKRSIYERHGLFNTNFKYAMDYELLLRVHVKGVRFVYMNNIIANMRLAGISDKGWITAYRETLKAKKAHLRDHIIKHYCYFYFQIVRTVLSRLMERRGLSSIRELYRKKLSLVRKYKNQEF